MTAWSGRQAAADVEWRMEREQAQRVPCPRCNAGLGETCVNTYTGQLLEKAPAHWQRFVRRRARHRPGHGSPNVLLYVDPPYLGSTRVSGGYRHEMKTEAEHRELADALNACRAAVVLSGYDSPLYLELYDGWHVTRIPTTTGQGGSREERTEVLWCNRAPVPDLFGEAS